MVTSWNGDVVMNPEKRFYQTVIDQTTNGLMTFTFPSDDKNYFFRQVWQGKGDKEKPKFYFIFLSLFQSCVVKLKLNSNLKQTVDKTYLKSHFLVSFSSKNYIHISEFQSNLFPDIMYLKFSLKWSSAPLLFIITLIHCTNSYSGFYRFGQASFD